MGNIKQQIEELNQSIAEINQARDKTVKYFENKIKQLEQQVNKPKIEVGKVIKVITGGKGAYGADNELGFLLQNINHDKADHGATENISFMVRLISGRIWALGFNAKIEEATKEEWETALTKHADKLYEGVKKVDRSGMDFVWSDIESFKGHLSTVWNGKEFQYKGIFVMDKHGVWAKPCASLKEMFVNVHLVDGDNSCGTIYYDASEAKNSTTGVFKHLGVFKLVKVG